jgi:predicted permease
MLQDLTYGLRAVRRTAPLSAGVVLTLIVGLGVNSVVFSIFNGLLLRAPVTRDPSSFVQIYASLSGRWYREFHGPASLATLEEFEIVRAETKTMAAVAASRWASFALDGAASGVLRGKFVSCNYLAAHVGPMILGRGFVEADCGRSGGQPVVVLSERSWNLRFGRDAAVIGREVRLNNQPLTVIGIAPDDAAGDPIAAMAYVPYTLQPILQGPADYFREPHDRHAWLNLSARLQPGRSVGEAQAELDVVAASLDRLHPGQVTGLLVTDGAIIHEPGTARSMPLLIGLCLGSTALILLMVCANVTTLMLARAVARRHEMAVRLSLGASRARLVRQMLTESIALAIVAASGSMVLAWQLPARVAQLLTDFPLQDAFAPDWRVFTFTFALAVTAGSVSGLSPAWESLRLSIAGALAATRHGQAGHISPRLGGTLVANQLTISLALLIAIALMLRAQHRLLDVRLDYDAGATLVTSVDLAHAGYSGRAAREFYDRLIPAMRDRPGVGLVALSSPPPFRGLSRTTLTRDAGGNPSLVTSFRSVSPDYFPIAGVRVLQGRLFTDSEARTPGRVMPVVVSESLARLVFQGGRSVGRRVRFGNDDPAEIVGVVSDTSSIRPGERDDPMLYQPIHTANVTSLAMMLRFSGDAASIVRATRAEVQAIDSRLSAAPETIAATIARDADRYSALVAMTAVPAGLALFLSMIAIYGLTAFAAAQRTHEIGVRVALGARPDQVIGLFFAALRRPFAVGAIAGSALAALGVTLVARADLMPTVSARDPLAYAVAIVVLLCTAAVATLIPAFRAARKEPWAALGAP